MKLLDVLKTQNPKLAEDVVWFLAIAQANQGKKR